MILEEDIRLNGFYKEDNGIKKFFKVCSRCNSEYTFSEGMKNIYASKYCPDCSKIVKKEQARERQARFRAKHKKGV